MCQSPEWADTSLACPRITVISPGVGSTKGGTTVQINGTSFFDSPDLTGYPLKIIINESSLV